MNQRIRSRTNPCAVEHTVTVRKPSYATQMAISPSRRKSPWLRRIFLTFRPCRRVRIAQPFIGCSDLNLGGATLKKECTLRSITVRLILKEALLSKGAAEESAAAQS